MSAVDTVNCTGLAGSTNFCSQSSRSCWPSHPCRSLPLGPRAFPRMPCPRMDSVYREKGMVRAAGGTLEPAPHPHDLVVIERHHRDGGEVDPFNRRSVAAGFQAPACSLELVHDRDDVAAGVSLRIRE